MLALSLIFWEPWRHDVAQSIQMHSTALGSALAEQDLTQPTTIFQTTKDLGEKEQGFDIRTVKVTWDLERHNGPLRLPPAAYKSQS
jgi:hypothetical protein